MPEYTAAPRTSGNYLGLWRCQCGRNHPLKRQFSHRPLCRWLCQYILLHAVACMHRNKQRSSCRMCRLLPSLAVPLQGWAFQHAGGGTEKQLPPEKVYKCPEPNKNAADILQIFPMSPCRRSLSAESKSRRKLPSSGQKCPNHTLQKSWYCPERMRSSVP